MEAGGGHYEFLQERKAAIVAANPHLAERILGRPPIERTPVEPPAPAPTPPRKPVPLSAQRIINAVAAAWSIPPGSICMELRSNYLTRPRFACYLLMGTHLGWGKDRIGKALRRDRSTVLNGQRRAGELYGYDRDWKQRYDAACASLGITP